MTHKPEADQLWPRMVTPQDDIMEYPGLLLAAIVESCEDAIISKSLSGLVTSWNRAAVRLLGYTAEEMIGQPILRLIPEELRTEELEILRRIALGERIEHYETVRVRKDGGRIDVCLSISPIRDYLGAIVGASKIMRDLAPERRREEAQARLAAIVESSEYAIVGKDMNGTITSWNAAAAAMFGYAEQEMIGQPILKLVPEELHPQEAEILNKLRRGLKIEHFRTVRVRRDGSRVDVSLTISPIKDAQGRVIGSSKIARDISAEKRREEQLAHFSYHDQLTGLPNRQLMHDRLGMMLAQAERNSLPCAVMVLDLNKFKEVNDQHGHPAGDRLLVETARRLKACLREVDTVCRIGGDEFVILVSSLPGPEDALLVAKKLRESLGLPFLVSADIAVRIGVSIGICMNTPGNRDGAMLLRMADTAMYHAKSSNSGQIEFYSGAIARHELRRSQIISATQEALQTDGFRLDYQPIVDMRSGSVLGFECLIRMHHPRIGIVQPNEFIPIAEETGMIRRIGAWVIGKACQDVGELNRTLGAAFSIAVNLSPKQFQDESLLGVIEAALRDNNLGRGQLEIEITEGVLMKDSPDILRFLHSLRAMGVLIDIDDFGTGFSNISYLWRFPIDRLKLDRSIVGSLNSHPESSVVAKAIIALAHQLNISVIAEGIETPEQAAIVKNAACDFAQGFHFARPAPLEDHKILLGGR